MSGNGMRAARREKMLTKPVLSGKAPVAFVAINPGAGTYLRQRAHRIERRFAKRQLTVANNSEERFSVDIVHKKAKPVSDWTIARAQKSVSVTAQRGQLQFH